MDFSIQLIQTIGQELFLDRNLKWTHVVEDREEPESGRLPQCRMNFLFDSNEESHTGARGSGSWVLPDERKT